jgi:predicted aspartyl protease
MEFPYQEFSADSTPVVPVIPIEVFHESFSAPLQVFAKVDTGYPKGFIMSETLGKTIKDSYRVLTDETDNLVAIGVFTVFCEVFRLAIKLPEGRWVWVRSFLPQGIDLGNVIGMELLSTVNARFKGKERKLELTSCKGREVSKA